MRQTGWTIAVVIAVGLSAGTVWPADDTIAPQPAPALPQAIPGPAPDRKPADAAPAEATANQLALKPDSRAKVKAWAMAADPRVSGEALYEDLTTDLRPGLAAIKTPITLVYPTSDEADALYRGAYGAAAKVTYVGVADTAHFVMLDQPAAFAAALKVFVDAK